MNSIDIAILWLEDCLKPLFSYKTEPLTHREQLDMQKNSNITHNSADIDVILGDKLKVEEGSDLFVDDSESEGADILPFPLKDSFQDVVDATVQSMGGAVEYSENMDDIDNDMDFDAERVVFITLPWGQIVPIPFTGDQWRMVYEISQESGEPMHKVVEDTVQQRYELASYLTEDYINKEILGGTDIEDDHNDTEE